MGTINPHRKRSNIIGTWTAGGPTYERDAADVDAIIQGVVCAERAAKELGWPNIWLVTNTQDAIEEHRVRQITAAFGGETLRAWRGKRAVQWDGLRFGHATPRTLAARGVGEAIVALYPVASTLHALDRLRVDHALTVVPGPDDVARWVRRWGATDPFVEAENRRVGPVEE